VAGWIEEYSDVLLGLGCGADGPAEELLVADGGLVSTEDLLERVWDENADPFTRTVTVTIGRLRRKLGEPDLIDTVVGSGYRLP